MSKFGRWVKKVGRSIDPTYSQSWWRRGLRAIDPTKKPQIPNPLFEAPQDPFEVMLREAALSSIRAKQRGDRMASFQTGPRGLEGPAKTVLG